MCIYIKSTQYEKEPEIIDTSSPEIPASLSEGIEFVIVSGIVVKDENGINSTKRHGNPIRNNFAANSR